jgi:octaprenyl-diphosphate synthase
MSAALAVAVETAGEVGQVAVIVALDRGAERKPSLEPLIALVRDDLDRVNDEIVKRMESRVPLIPQLAGHIIASGGKRLRPMLTLAAARLCGYRGSRQVLLAACVEFIHTATLLHDDVVDASELRRGKKTANTVWGNEASVLVGDFLFTRSFQLMVEDGSLEVLRILCNASAVIAEGEVQQLTTSNDTATSEDAYLEVISAKTAALFAAACRVGAVIADRPKAECDALESYGRNLGIAFQLVDDALDYAGRSASFGKNVGDDFKEGKITLPVILAFRRGEAEERAFWKRTLERRQQAEGDLERAIALMEKHGTLRATIDRARHYGAMARDALGLFPDGELKSAMIEAIDFSIDRAH